MVPTRATRKGRRARAAVQPARQIGSHNGMLQARSLQALAAPTSADALPFLAEGLTLGEPGGYVRTFVEQVSPWRPR